MKNPLDRLKNLSVNEIDVGQSIKREVLYKDFGFPMVIEPANSGLDLTAWMAENKESFEKDLVNYGAILFRNFRINTVDKFQELMNSFPNELLEYKLRSSPRHSLANNVYVSTTYPNDQSIEMHSESSYAPNHPERIVFCCIVAAEVQGETPIADNRKVWANLSDTTAAKFLSKGIQYRRNLNGLLGLPWQEVFQTTDKAIVEEECRRTHLDFEWKSDSHLVLSWTKKAIWNHPVTNEQIWFNHGFFFNKYNLQSEILNAVKRDDDLPNNTFFGDGSQISQQEIEELRTAYKNSTISFPWQKGDVLFLDNMLMSHGRNPYKGDRKIIVSMF